MILARLFWLTDRLIDLSVIAGAAGLLVALGVTATDVVGRAFGTPLYGARDIVSMAGVFVVFGGMAQAHRMGSHVAVDLLERHFPARLNRVLDVFAHWAGALVFGLINQAVALAFGPTLLAAAIGVAVYWVQLLLNLALMTTLYGNLIEGRQLN